MAQKDSVKIPIDKIKDTPMPPYNYQKPQNCSGRAGTSSSTRSFEKTYRRRRKALKALADK